MDSFHEGIIYSASLLVEFIDQPTYAADILEQAGLLDHDVSNMDECERYAMGKLMVTEHRVKMIGTLLSK